MKLSVALLLLACAGALGSEDPTVQLPGVTDLTPSNFASLHTGKKAALIEFYAPWCGHCKRIVPEYSKLGERIAADPKLKNRVLIAKVDADAHRDLGGKFGVRGFPTIKWFPRGKPNDPETYNGGRTADDFLKFISEKVAADAGFARVDALVPLAFKFYSTDADPGVLAEAGDVYETVPEADKENAELYLRYMKKAVEKGGREYLDTELERLTKMSEKPMSAAKLDEVSRKISILQSFAEAPEEAERDAPVPSDDDVEGYEADESDDGMVYDDGLDDNEGAEIEEEGEEEEGDEDYDDHEGHDHEGHDHEVEEEDDEYE